MYKNYLKVAFRFLIKQKIHSCVSIGSLALGFTFFIFTYLFVTHELSYDRFHENGKSIFRIFNADGNNRFGTLLSTRMRTPLLENISGIKYVTGIRYHNSKIRHNNSIFKEMIIFAEPDFTEMFTFPLIAGNSNELYHNKHSIIITKRTAHKYFGSIDAIGKTLQINLGEFYSTGQFEDFIITGVCKNIPTNSSFQFDIILPFEKIITSGEYNPSLMQYDTEIFIQLENNKTAADIDRQLPAFFSKYITEAYRQQSRTDFEIGKYSLQPLSDIHFNRYLNESLLYEGRIQSIFIMICISLVLLIMSCVNFINLSNSRITERFKEIGIRKTSGAHNRDIMYQFLGESVIYTLIAFIIAIIVAELLLPIFNNILQKDLNMSILLNIKLLLLLVFIILLIGSIVGLFPAIFNSRHHPVLIIKGGSIKGKKNIYNNIFILTQFACMILFTIISIVITKQVHFMKSKNLGFKSSEIAFINTDDLTSQESRKIYNLFKTELPQYINIENVSWVYGGKLTGDYEKRGGCRIENEEIRPNTILVGSDFVRTLGIDLIEGRDFSDYTSWGEQIIVNESFIKKYGWDVYSGEKSIRFMNDNTTIIGVVKDFHFRSLHNKISPAILYQGPDKMLSEILIRITNNDQPQTLNLIQKKWQQVFPDYQFNYSILTDEINKQYQQENSWNRMAAALTTLIMLIAYSGLFAFSLIIVTKRTKEIGIRKVLGATSTNILDIYFKDITKWILISNLIAWPVAFVIMNKWLQNFAYRTEMSWWIFAFAGFLALIIALITVSWQTIRAAMANPVDVLKYE